MKSRGLKIGAIIALCYISGCSADYYRNSADDEVYSIIRQAEDPAEGSQETESLKMESDFVHEQQPMAPTEVGLVLPVQDFKNFPAPEAREISLSLPIDGDEFDPPEKPVSGDAEPSGEVTEADSDSDSDSDSEKDTDTETGAEADTEANPESESDSEAGTKTDPGSDSAAPEKGSGADGQNSPAIAQNSPAIAQDDADVDAAASSDGAEGAGAASKLRGSIDIPGAPLTSVRVLTLDDALRLAFANNRDYQSDREQVYLEALSLTLARFQFAPRFLGFVTGSYEGGPIAESGSLNSVFQWNQLLASGARLSMTLSSNLFQFFSGDRAEIATTMASAAITQPLLRGFGSDVVLEPLVQEERNVVYQLRRFRRFQQTFATRVVSEYFGMLQDRDQVVNEYINWRDLVENRTRVESMAEAGRLTTIEVGQAQQQELQAEDRYISSVQFYDNARDDFKITLGIPIDIEIAPDPRELEELIRIGVEEIDVELLDALTTARRERFDLLNASGEVEDAERQIKVIADSLRTQLDIDGNAGLVSGKTNTQIPFRFTSNNLTYGLGFTLDLPLDRKFERNLYVSSLISYDRQVRRYTLLRDTVDVDVRRAYRTLNREIRSYPIQQRSVIVADERVDSTTMLRQAGSATTRDVLESQQDLVDAKNNLTISLITYTIAKLQLFSQMGILLVRKDGTLGGLNFTELSSEI